MDFKVTIGLPVYRDFHPNTTLSLMALASQFDFHISSHRGCFVHRNRELIMADAIAANSTHLMFIDSDVVFPAEAVNRLVMRNLPIIGASYNKRDTDPPESTAKMFDGGDKLRLVRPHELLKGEPFQVAAVPGGFMCINLQALLASNMRPPYFRISQDSQGEIVGEDVDFCLQAREFGLDVWCDPTIQVLHMGEKAY